MKRETFLTVAILLLFAMNLCLVAFFIFDRRMPPHKEKHETHKIIIETLRYDEQQQRQFDASRNEQHNEMERLNEQFDHVVNNYFSLLMNETVNVSAKDSLEQVMFDIQKRKANSLFNHFQQLKNICRDDQRQAFDELLPELMHLIKPPPDNGPPPSRRN